MTIPPVNRDDLTLAADLCREVAREYISEAHDARNGGYPPDEIEHYIANQTFYANNWRARAARFGALARTYPKP